MRQLQLALTFLTLSYACFGQNESAVNLTDTLVKNEIAMFNFNNYQLTQTNTLNQSTLTEIPFVSCDGKSVNFYKGDTFIHLYFDQNPEGISFLDSIYVIIHSHFVVTFPKSAFGGLYNTITCDFRQESKSNQNVSPFFKAFQSKDKRRIYIYMVGGVGTDRYEVTWVIVDSKFHIRTVDPICY
jgi:hypothetical protein